MRKPSGGNSGGRLRRKSDSVPARNADRRVTAPPANVTHCQDEIERSVDRQLDANVLDHARSATR